MTPCHLTAKVILKKANKNYDNFDNRIEKDICTHEDKTYSGVTSNVFLKKNQYIHAGIVEPYDSRMIKEDKSYMLFTLKADGFENLPSELNVDTSLICGLGLIKKKGSEFITGSKTKSSKSAQLDDKRVGKIYCYEHTTKHSDGDKGYTLFRFPFQELNEIYNADISGSIKNKIENIISKLTIPNEERIFFKWQSHLIPSSIVAKYSKVLYDQIMFIKQDTELNELVNKKTNELNLDFCNNFGINFLDNTIELVSRTMENMIYPGLWGLVNYLNIEPKKELLKVLTKNYIYKRDIFINPDVDNKFYNTIEAKFILDFLIHLPLQKEHYERIFSQYSLDVSSNKSTQTIDFIRLNDLSLRNRLNEIIDNPYLLFEDYIQNDNIPLLFEDIDWAIKSKKFFTKDFDKYSSNRFKALVIDYIKKQEFTSGNIWVHRDDVYNHIIDKLLVLDMTSHIDFDKFSETVNDENFFENFELDESKQFLTTKDLFKKESYISNILSSKISINKEYIVKNDGVLEKLFDENIEFIFLSGVAGAGKSHNLCRYLNEVYKDLTFQVLSPTGKSANVLKKKIKENSEFKNIFEFLNNKDNSNKILTAHQFLVNHGFWNYELFSIVEKKEIPKQELDVLIIDEISMFTLDLIYFIFKAVNAKKIIFIGDIKQIKPIGYGDIAFSIYNHLKVIDSISLIELHESKRAKEGAKFIDLSLDLRSSDHTNICEYLKISDKSMETRYYKNSEQLYSNLEDIFQQTFSQESFSKNILTLSTIENIDKLQIITPSNLGEFGSYSINNMLKSELGNEYKYNKTIKGLKFIKLVNNNSTGVMNGMFGVGLENKKVLFENQVSESNSSEIHSLGYSISIHKSQGSGFENVVLVLPARELSFITKELIYTAITRASKKLYILINEDNNDILDTLINENHRNSNLFPSDNSLLKKETVIEFYHFNWQHYRNKRDLYFGMLCNFSGLDIEKLRYGFNGIFRIKEKYQEKIINLHNFYEKFKVEIGNSGIYEEEKSINIRKIIEEFQIDFIRKDRSEENSVDFIKLIRQKNLEKNYEVKDDKAEIITHNGLKSRSWSEAILMLIFDNLGIKYKYEKRISEKLLPDFYFNENIVLEHLGMLENDNYLNHWNYKKQEYEKLGFEVCSINDVNISDLNKKICLTTTEEDIFYLDELISEFEDLRY